MNSALPCPGVARAFLFRCASAFACLGRTRRRGTRNPGLDDSIPLGLLSRCLFFSSTSAIPLKIEGNQIERLSDRILKSSLGPPGWQRADQTGRIMNLPSAWYGGISSAWVGCALAFSAGLAFSGRKACATGTAQGKSRVPCGHAQASGTSPEIHGQIHGVLPCIGIKTERTFNIQLRMPKGLQFARWLEVGR
jgi:hypothetical protein